MDALVRSLEQCGPALAVAIEARREPVCDATIDRLSLAFPSLYYTPGHPDPKLRQQRAYREVVSRFHGLIQVVLICRLPRVLERECFASWGTLPYFPIASRHRWAIAHWYLAAVGANVPLDRDSRGLISDLEHAIIEVVNHAEAAPAMPILTLAHS